MTIDYLVCAESISVDQTRNSISVFHIYEEFNSPTFPFVVPYFFVVGVFAKEAQEQDPDNISLGIFLGEEELLRGPFAINFQGKLRLRVMNQIGGLIITKPGVLKVCFFEGDKLIALWKMPVNNIGKPAPQMPLPVA